MLLQCNRVCQGCLVSLAKCLKKQAKDLDVSAATIKSCLKEELLQELTIRYVGEIPNPKTDYIDNVAIYDLCGFLVHVRPSLSSCANCKSLIVSSELLLPNDFTEADFTRLRTKGGLTFVSIAMFKTVRELELVIQSHFSNPNHFYVVETFQYCITTMCGAHLMGIFSDEHRADLISHLAMEYAKIRHHYEQKRLNNMLFGKSNAKVKSKFKEAKNS